MKHAKILVLLLTSAMLASCTKVPSDLTTEETSGAATTTRERSGDTSEAATVETEETEEDEGTAYDTVQQHGYYICDGCQIPPDTLSDILNDTDYGYPEYFRLPQAQIDSAEIDEMNQDIVNTLADWIGDEDPSTGYYSAGYALFSSTPGIYSIVISYDNLGLDGFYRTFTFDRAGHVYTTSEILSLALVSEEDFYGIAREATINHVNGWYTCDSVPLVTDGVINTENDYIGSEDDEMYGLLIEDLSETDINPDMPMFVDNDGCLCICQAIMPVAGGHYHAAERFYRVPDGYTIDIDYYHWWMG